MLRRKARAGGRLHTAEVAHLQCEVVHCCHKRGGGMNVTQRLRRPFHTHIAGFALRWVQALAEQREQRVKELEERVKAEKDAREAAVARANQVKHNTCTGK